MTNFKLTHSCVHVYTGDGKGKTTVALGIALRALGWGARVCMIQFIKGYPRIGEAFFAQQSEGRFVLRQFAGDASRNIGVDDVLARKQEAQDALAAAEQAVSGGEFDIVILDEINNALYYRLIDVDRVLKMLSDRPDSVEIILTGRGALKEIIEAADYVTELTPVKHPYEKNLQARAGIDF